MGAGEVEDLWRAYLMTLPDDSPARDEGYEAWSFGNGPQMAALWELEAEGEPAAQPGEKSVILNGKGKPLCIIETTEVAVRRFDEVDGRFARDEGEGDGSLEYWQGEHRRFFSRTLPEIGHRFSEDMPLVCERFRVVYRQNSYS
jgi:uncharacterized protein YhfF